MIEMDRPHPVFVHGNPETAAIWGPLRTAFAALGIGSGEALSPPGFGAALPADFAADADAYAAWLIGELERLGAPDRPVDLIGHDWGAGHVYRVVATRPDLVRSWIADIGGLLHPEYEWHDAARGWQTPGVGEEMVAAMVSMSIEDRAAVYESLGMTHDIAVDCAAAMNADMGEAILRLYRSAPESELRALADRLRSVHTSADGRPGCIVHAVGDEYVPAALGRAVVSELAHAGARVVGVDLERVGHWWMIEDPDGAAARIAGFWRDEVGLVVG